MTTQPQGFWEPGDAVSLQRLRLGTTQRGAAPTSFILDTEGNPTNLAQVLSSWQPYGGVPLAGVRGYDPNTGNQWYTYQPRDAAGDRVFYSSDDGRGDVRQRPVIYVSFISLPEDAPANTPSLRRLYDPADPPEFKAAPTAVPVVSGGSGSGATIHSITVDTRGRITDIVWNSGSSGYSPGDVITLTQGTVSTRYMLVTSDVSAGVLQNFTGKMIADPRSDISPSLLGATGNHTHPLFSAYTEFAASGVWTKPSDIDPTKPVLLVAIGGGGGGTTGTSGYGGGGGALITSLVWPDQLPDTLAVTVGASGAPNGNGGDTRIGTSALSFVRADGGTSGGLGGLGIVVNASGTWARTATGVRWGGSGGQNADTASRAATSGSAPISGAGAGGGGGSTSSPTGGTGSEGLAPSRSVEFPNDIAGLVGRGGNGSSIAGVVGQDGTDYGGGGGGAFVQGSGNGGGRGGRGLVRVYYSTT